MTAGTVFPATTLDPTALRWDDYLYALTPVTAGERVLYKREDHFAPLGYGGVNGSKLRQLVHLVHTARQEGAVGLLTGASVLSPQVSMSAVVAAHYGLPATIVLGGTRPDTCQRHENVRIALAAGAELRFVRVGYNPALQHAVGRLASAPEYRTHYRLAYGISTPADASPQEIAAFHQVGAAQVANLPDRVHTLVMPLGSGNTAASVLLGIALQQRPAALDRIVLLGVGPSRLEWLYQRLELLGEVLGHDVAGVYGPDGPVAVEHHDLHACGFARYADRMPYRLDGIDLHPTYEGKALHWMDRHRPAFGWWWHANHDVLLWIVGSEPSHTAMQDALG